MEVAAMWKKIAPSHEAELRAEAVLRELQVHQGMIDATVDPDGPSPKPADILSPKPADVLSPKLADAKPKDTSPSPLMPTPPVVQRTEALIKAKPCLVEASVQNDKPQPQPSNVSKATPIQEEDISEFDLPRGYPYPFILSEEDAAALPPSPKIGEKGNWKKLVARQKAFSELRRVRGSEA